MQSDHQFFYIHKGTLWDAGAISILCHMSSIWPAEVNYFDPTMFYISSISHSSFVCTLYMFFINETLYTGQRSNCLLYFTDEKEN